MIFKLEDVVGKDIELLIGGHFFTGRVVEVDSASHTIVFKEQDEDGTYVVNVDSIALFREIA